MEKELILSKILEIGEETLVSGGETSRVEDSISRLCVIYHMKDINVYSIITNIIVTVTDEDGKSIQSDPVSVGKPKKI